MPGPSSTSARPHLALMVTGATIVAVIGLLLLAGWRWHFSEMERRTALMRLSREVDEQNAEKAVQDAARLKATATAFLTPPPQPPAPAASDTPATAPPPAGPSTPGDALPGKPAGVSLATVTGADNGSLFPDPEALTSEVDEVRLKEAAELQQRFLNATGWKDKLACVREPERVGPLMRDYYEVQKRTEPLITGTPRQTHLKINATEILLFSYTGTRPSQSVDMALVSPQLGGKFQIDWESYVGASEMAWTDFKKQRPETPQLFRLFAKLDDYYNYEFSDDKKYLSLNLQSADGLYFVYGYCERGSPIARTLTSLLQGGASTAPLTLRLAYMPMSGSDHCVRITGVVANRWLLVK